jgi:CheY-like chemotaxis protein
VTETARILLAEDEAVIACIIEDLLAAEGYRVDACADGAQAWERLRHDGEAYDAIILDRMMPGMDGMEVLRRAKAEPALARVPVIMETSQGDLESIREGLAEGAYYYLTKPFQPDVLVAVTRAAVEQTREYRRLASHLAQAERPIAFMKSGEFRFRDLEEGRLLANFLALACPDPRKVAQGFQELLINAVEHGNLAIGYDDKSALIKAGTWQDEVKRRLALPEYRDRWVEVGFARAADELRFTIRDQGAGFDWSDYLEFSAERAFDPHGRGIAMARKLCFDRCEYQGNGNTVLVGVALGADAPGLDGA